MLARLCDATRVITLSGRLDPDTITTLRQRISIEPTEGGGSDDAVVVAQLEHMIERLRDELGANY